MASKDGKSELRSLTAQKKRKSISDQFKEKEAKINAEIEEIKEELHPEVKNYIAQLTLEKETNLLTLQKWKQNQLHSIEIASDMERKECQLQFELSITEVKEQLLSLCQQAIRDEDIANDFIMENQNSNDGSTFAGTDSI